MKKEQLAALFNEWAKRYSKNPSEFSDVLDKDGNPVSDYGILCTEYFTKLTKEMQLTEL